MWFVRIIFVVSCVTVCCGYIISKPKESELRIPEYLEEFEKLTFPEGSDSTRLVRAERAVAKYDVLEITLQLPQEKSSEITLEKCIFLYIPHRGNNPNARYTATIRDLFTGRVIAYKSLLVQNSGWYKVCLSHWPNDSERRLGLISANQGLAIHLEEKGGKIFDFEEFYKGGENFNYEFVPSMLVYHKHEIPNSLQEFFYMEKSNMTTSELPAGRVRRSTSNTQCSYIVEDTVKSLNLTFLSIQEYYPNTTKICTGGCSPSVSAGSTCNQSVHNCCVPSKMQSFFILYVDTHGTVLRRIPDAIVEECACANSIGNGR
ncbi:uncharacterized protein LOC114523239 [Dendronephthya gigantea]|uniref:uncharacterized protein LOC114523239 n=1 Tax=Dendronephthya gigantea TaxID=151771 RepID=UPI00106B9BF0|nr:uncharacterized protein LOC114523239 [Dendronephthya gigantea]